MLGKTNPLIRLGRALRGAVRHRAAPPGPPRPTRVAAHRGAARSEPENTVRALRRALDDGADGAEVDVCVTRDGEWVLWHDARPDGKVALARQTAGEGYAFVPDMPPLGSRFRKRVDQLAFEEFRAHHGYLPAQRNGNGQSGARVPVSRLTELLAYAAGDRRLRVLYVDLKLEPELADRAGELVELLARAAPPWTTVGILSVHAPVVRALGEAVAAQPREGLDVYPDFELPGALVTARRLGVPRVSVGLGQRFYTDFRDELVDLVAARDRGELESVLVWTVNPVKRLRQLVDLRVDAIVTDEAVLLRGLLAARGASLPD